MLNLKKHITFEALNKRSRKVSMYTRTFDIFYYVDESEDDGEGCKLISRRIDYTLNKEIDDNYQTYSLRLNKQGDKI